MTPAWYETVKWIHAGCAGTSYSLFFLRGVWRFRDSPRIRDRWVRVAPHLVDTVLLASALTLASQWLRVPAMHAFLLTKVLALVAYILLGMLAFRWGRTRSIRLTAWVGAQAVFLYIVGVAITKSPGWFLPGPPY
ncbi:MAG: regulator SirB [Betaproteobacteria bacterium]|nr:regulator SirB [Betaproteobacteria bacterium]